MLSPSSPGTAPLPPLLPPAPALAAELWDAVSKWGMVSANGGCGHAPQDTGCMCRLCMCGWIMLVPHCSALLPLADRNMTGRLVYDRLWARVCLHVCVFVRLCWCRFNHNLRTNPTTDIPMSYIMYITDAWWHLNAESTLPASGGACVCGVWCVWCVPYSPTKDFQI